MSALGRLCGRGTVTLIYRRPRSPFYNGVMRRRMSQRRAACEIATGKSVIRPYRAASSYKAFHFVLRHHAHS